MSAKWFSKYDIEEAYYHIKIHPDDQYLTAFRTPRCIFEYTVMPFGLSTAPAEWQLYLESVSWEFLGIRCSTYQRCLACQTLASLNPGNYFCSSKLQVVFLSMGFKV